MKTLKKFVHHLSFLFWAYVRRKLQSEEIRQLLATVIKRGENIMSGLSEIQQATADLKTAIAREADEVKAKIDALKAQIDAGASDAELHAAADEIRAAIASVDNLVVPESAPAEEGLQPT